MMCEFVDKTQQDIRQVQSAQTRQIKQDIIYPSQRPISGER